jgi:putative ABC transport system substrate-binding protein
VTSTAALIAALSLLTAAPGAFAQPAGKMYRIGVLANALDTADGPLFGVFLETLGKLGYVQDRTFVIDWRSSEGDADQLPALAGNLLRAKVDIIFATALRPAQAAVEATKTVPIVFVAVADPVRYGLVSNLAKPGGNATGVATYADQESGERALALLKEAASKISRVGVVMNPTNPVHQELMAKVLPSAASRLSLTLLPLELKGPGDLPGIFEMAAHDRADSLYVLGDVLTFLYRARIVELAAKNRLPAIYASRRGAEAGGLMSYGPYLPDLFRRAAVYVDKILKGASPGGMAVERPTRQELVINLKAAKALGLTVPAGLLRRADEVIRE